MQVYHKILQQIIVESSTGIKAISESEMSYKPAAGKWSKKEILGHLIDSAYNNHQRFIRAENKGDLIFGGYNQDEWVLRNNYQNRKVDEVLSLWVLVNNHLVLLIAALSDETLYTETVKHNFNKICLNLIEDQVPTSLSYLVWDYISHTEYHLAQIVADYVSVNGEYMKR